MLIRDSDGNNFLSLFYWQQLILHAQTIRFTPKTITMNELIERLMKEAGLNQEQATKAIETIAGFVKDKFPMLGGAVDQIFSAGNKED